MHTSPSLMRTSTCFWPAAPSWTTEGNASGGGLYVVALETRAEAEAFIAVDPFFTQACSNAFRSPAGARPMWMACAICRRRNDGRTLVTGGAGGIGLAVARQERMAGRAVVVLDREPPPPDLEARFLCVDLMSEAATAGALTEALSEGRSPAS